jgi:UBX domain-containing protein 7
MVNIMNSQEFACQILNRDLWSNKEVQRTVSSNFFFLQYTVDEPEGIRYQRTYPFDEHPHIGIIDPRTGEQVKTWNKIMTAPEFLFEVHEFLSRFSLSEEARNPLGRKGKIKKVVTLQFC